MSISGGTEGAKDVSSHRQQGDTRGISNVRLTVETGNNWRQDGEKTSFLTALDGTVRPMSR